MIKDILASLGIIKAEHNIPRKVWYGTMFVVFVIWLIWYLTK